MPSRSRHRTNPHVAVGYVRKSSDEPGHGPAAQRAAIERWAKLHDVTVVSVHEDIGVSGALPIDRRPGLLAALAAMKTAEAGLMIVARRDRIARDIAISLAIERIVSRLGATICAADGAGNGAAPEAELLRGLLDLFAGFERSLIRSRTRAALEAKRARGERTGYVAYGYSLAEDGKHLMLNEAEQRVVDLIQTLSAEGLSSRRIAARLNELGCPARGERWHATTVLQLVRRQQPLT